MVDLELTTRPPNGRGCGDRKEREPYCCSGSSPFGKPIEEFIVDPVRIWPTGWQRGVKPIQRKSGIFDVAVFIGREYWPSPWDKIEEVRRYGESRRFPKNFPFDILTPFQSRMLFIHALTIPRFAYQCDRTKPLAGCKVFQDDLDLWDDPSVIPGWHPVIEEVESPCAFALQDLAYLVNNDHKHLGNVGTLGNPHGEFVVHTPSFDYYGNYPYPYVYREEMEKGGWEAAGLFLALPLTHLEYKGQVDEESARQAKEAGFEVIVLDY